MYVHKKYVSILHVLVKSSLVFFCKKILIELYKYALNLHTNICVC